MAEQAIGRADAVSVRQLRLFVAIAELKSVRRASEECSLSQPAVTQALAKLEEQIGAQLIQRRPEGSYPNEAGLIFEGRTRRFFAQMEDAVKEIGAACTDRAAGAIANRLTRAQLRTLIGVIEYGSFERAATAFGISISSLQRAARDLESNVRVPLFHRTATGMLVSRAGATFGRRMKLALQEIDWAIEEIEELMGRSSRQTVIGAMPFGGSVLLSSMLDDFLLMHPTANIHIINDSAPKLTKSLRDGDVDLVIGLLPETIDDELLGTPLAPTPFSIVARRDHPLADQLSVAVADLAPYDWVIGTEGSGRRACFDRLFAEEEKPTARISTCALTVLNHLLVTSNRLALMTEYEIENGDAPLRSLAFGPIAPTPSIGIMTRANWLPTRLQADFVDVVRRRVTTPRSGARHAG